MNLSLDNNVNKFVLLVVCGVIVLLVVNMNKKKLGNQVCTLISILVIVLSGFFGYTLLNQENEMFYINTSLGNNNVPFDLGTKDDDVFPGEDIDADPPLIEAESIMAEKDNMTHEEISNKYASEIADAEYASEIADAEYASEIAEAQAMMSSSDKDSLEPFQNSSVATSAVATSAVASSANSSATLNAKELLPSDNSLFNNINPQINDSKINDQNLLIAGHHIGVNTVGCSLRNANRGLRSDPPCPTTPVSPWMQTTICPDLLRKSLDPVPSPTLSFSP